jgi:hypothetical protein
MTQCTKCASYTINKHCHDKQKGADSDLCDVCYWRKCADHFKARAEALERIVRGSRDTNCKSCVHRIADRNKKPCVVCWGTGTDWQLDQSRFEEPANG